MYTIYMMRWLFRGMDISIRQHDVLSTISNPACAGSADVDYSKLVHSMSQPFMSFRMDEFSIETLRSNGDINSCSIDQSIDRRR